MQEVQQSKEKTLVSNRTLAEQNLALQPQLEHKKGQLTKRYGCLQEKFESYQLRKSTLGTAARQQGRVTSGNDGGHLTASQLLIRQSSWGGGNSLRVVTWCL